MCGLNASQSSHRPHHHQHAFHKVFIFFISFKLPTITILILLKVINFYDPPAHNNHQTDHRRDEKLLVTVTIGVMRLLATRFTHTHFNTYKPIATLSFLTQRIDERFEMVLNKTKICIFCYKIQPQNSDYRIFIFTFYPLNLDKLLTATSNQPVDEPSTDRTHTMKGFVCNNHTTFIIYTIRKREKTARLVPLVLFILFFISFIYSFFVVKISHFV